MTKSTLKTLNTSTTTLVGSFARDPEVTVTSGGTVVFEATVAGEETVTSSDGKVRTLPFYQRVSALGKYAEMLSERGYTAGTPVLVEGRAEDNRFTTEDGLKVRNIRVRANRIDALAEDVQLIKDAAGGLRMKEGRNITTIVGNLTELRYTPGGDAVLNMSVAVNEV